MTAFVPARRFDDSDRRQSRYLHEGICPACHVPMERAGAIWARCPKCRGNWTSDKVDRVFPHASK